LIPIKFETLKPPIVRPALTLYTVKKDSDFSIPSRDVTKPNSPWPGIINSPWQGIIYLFPARKSLLSDILLYAANMAEISTVANNATVLGSTP
jgi:hypothetical protein